MTTKNVKWRDGKEKIQTRYWKEEKRGKRTRERVRKGKDEYSLFIDSEKDNVHPKTAPLFSHGYRVGKERKGKVISYFI